MNRRWRPELPLGCGMHGSIYTRGRKMLAAQDMAALGPASVARQVVHYASQSGEVHLNVSGLCDGLGLSL
jgi:hypothetical protein